MGCFRLIRFTGMSGRFEKAPFGGNVPPPIIAPVFADVKSLVKKMFHNVFGYINFPGSWPERLAKPLVLDALVADQVFNFIEEGFDVLKVAINRSEANISDLVERAQTLHQHFSYFNS